jgi:hypothetical protein
MKPHTISKIIAALLLGILLGGAAHHSYVTQGQLGREDFLAKEGVRFDKFYAKPHSISVVMLASVIMTGFAFGAYEVVAFGFSKILKRTDDEAA